MSTVRPGDGQQIGGGGGGGGGAYAPLAGAGFTGAVTITQDVGVAQTRGLAIQTTALATASNQKWSPVFELQGNVWDTTLALSKVVIHRAQLETTAGTTPNRLGNLKFSANIDGGAFITSQQILLDGSIALGAASPLPGAGAGVLLMTTGGGIRSVASGNFRNVIAIANSSTSFGTTADAVTQLQAQAVTIQGVATLYLESVDTYFLDGTGANVGGRINVANNYTQWGRGDGTATPVGWLTKGPGSRVGTDVNIAGGPLTFQGGPGTGTAAPAGVILRAAVTGTVSGSGAQTFVDAFTVTGDRTAHLVRAKLYTATLATITALPGAVAGDTAYATDLRNGAEGASAGTGGPVYFGNAAWRRYSDAAAATA